MTQDIRRTGLAALAVRVAATAYHRLLRAKWYVTRPVTQGVRALPLTQGGRIVLIRHTYVRGWHLPGGGRGAREDAQAALLRELREEIGLVAHGAVEPIADFTHRPDFKRDTVAFFIVRDVEFVPRLSLEIEAIAAFAPDALPEGVSDATRRRIAEWLGAAPRAAEW